MNIRPQQPKPKRKSKAEKRAEAPSQGKLFLQRIQPETKNQQHYIENFRNHEVTVCHGYPGTGKTFLALYLALNELQRNPDLKKIVILRSSVSGRDMGFLPGKMADKMAPFEGPYIDICSKLYGRGDAWQILKQHGTVEFLPTAFLRGMTFDNCVVIVEEFQNMSWQELSTIATRKGKNCLITFIGDKAQDDLTSKRYNEESGAPRLLEVLSKINDVGFTYMNVDDIVRDGFVKSFIVAQYDIRSIL